MRCAVVCVLVCAVVCVLVCVLVCAVLVCAVVCVLVCAVSLSFIHRRVVFDVQGTRNMYRLIKNTYQRTNRCGSSNISCASLLSSICYYLFHPFTRFFPSTNRNCVGVYLCVYLCVFVCVYLLVCVFVYLILFILLCHFCVTLHKNESECIEFTKIITK